MLSLQLDHTQFSLSEWGLSAFGVEGDVSGGKSCETFTIFLKVSEISGDSVGSAADQWEHTFPTPPVRPAEHHPLMLAGSQLKADDMCHRIFLPNLSPLPADQ